MEDGRHLNDDEDNSLLNNQEALKTIKNRFEELLDEMSEIKDLVKQQINSLERKIENLDKEI